MAHRIRKVFIVLLLLTLLPASAQVTTARAEARLISRVYDYAGLFSSSEKSALQDSLDEATGQISADMVVLTVGTDTNKSEKAYAKEFLLNNGFGVGEGRESILFMINMNTRLYTVFEYNTEASGYVLTDDEVDLILADCRSSMKAGRFADAAQKFISSAIYYAGVDVGQNYAEGSRDVDTSPPLLYRWLISLVCGGVVGALLTFFIVAGRNHDEKVSAVVYGHGPVNILRKQDRFLRTSVVVHHFENSSGSGGGGGGGGFSSGGTSGGGHGGSAGF